VAVLSACGSSSSSSSSTTGAASATDTSTMSSTTSTGTGTGSTSGAAMTTTTCPTGAAVSAGLGGTFTLSHSTSPTSGAIICTYRSGGSDAASITYAVQPNGTESALKANLKRLASTLGKNGGKAVSGVGDAAYVGTTTFGATTATAIYAVKGNESLVLVATAPQSAVESYANTLLG